MTHVGAHLNFILESQHGSVMWVCRGRLREKLEIKWTGVQYDWHKVSSPKQRRGDSWWGLWGTEEKLLTVQTNWLLPDYWSQIQNNKICDHLHSLWSCIKFSFRVFFPLGNRWFSVDEKQDLISSLSKLVLVICWTLHGKSQTSLFPIMASQLVTAWKVLTLPVWTFRNCIYCLTTHPTVQSRLGKWYKSEVFYWLSRGLNLSSRDKTKVSHHLILPLCIFLLHTLLVPFHFYFQYFKLQQTAVFSK